MGGGAGPAQGNNNAGGAQGGGNLLNGTSGNAAAPAAKKDDLLDLLGGGPVAPSGGGQQPQQLSGGGGALDLLGGGNTAPSNPGGDLLSGIMGGDAPAAGGKQFVALNKNGLQISFNCKKSGTVTSTQATFENSTGNPMSDFAFEVAVPKFLQLRINKATGNSLPPNGGHPQVTQTFDIDNPQGKPTAIRMRIRYQTNGVPVQLMEQTEYPAGF